MAPAVTPIPAPALTPVTRRSYATEAVNLISTPSGRVLMVCEVCGRITGSRADKRDTPTGWWTVPYSDDVVHPDGSRGSLYICPEDGKRDTFRSREYLSNRRPARDWTRAGSA